MEPRFSLTLGTWAIARAEKNSVRILKYGPRTRSVRAISDGKVVLTNRFETRASLVSLKLMKIVFNAMNKYDFGSLSILTEWFRQIEALVVLAKTMINIAILCNKRKWRFVQVFPFSWRSQKKGENSKVESVISSKCVVRVHERTTMCTRINKNETEISVFLYLVRFDFFKGCT